MSETTSGFAPGRAWGADDTPSYQQGAVPAVAERGALRAESLSWSDVAKQQYGAFPGEQPEPVHASPATAVTIQEHRPATSTVTVTVPEPVQDDNDWIRDGCSAERRTRHAVLHPSSDPEIPDVMMP